MKTEGKNGANKKDFPNHWLFRSSLLDYVIKDMKTASKRKQLICSTNRTLCISKTKRTKS